MIKAFDKDDNEIEVYTAEEHTAAVDAAKKEVEGQFTPKVTALETELAGAKSALGIRAGEFKHFRELHADVVEKLSVAERTIYENQKAAEESRVAREKDEQDRVNRTVESTIRAKVGTDEKLFTKVKDMYSLIGIQAVTPDEIDRKVLATLGAIGTTEPDLLATIGFSGGSFTPPVEKEDDTSFADTDKGKAVAADLGLVFPEPKK